MHLSSHGSLNSGSKNGTFFPARLPAIIPTGSTALSCGRALPFPLAYPHWLPSRYPVLPAPPTHLSLLSPTLQLLQLLEESRGPSSAQETRVCRAVHTRVASAATAKSRTVLGASQSWPHTLPHDVCLLGNAVGGILV